MSLFCPSKWPLSEENFSPKFYRPCADENINILQKNTEVVLNGSEEVGQEVDEGKTNQIHVHVPLLLLEAYLYKGS
jgi:hypothetical protein